MGLQHVSGLVQFIESVAVAEIVDKHDSILNYFRKIAPSESAPLGVTPEVMDNYIKSCGEHYFFQYHVST